jgi:tRNA threonylcarbamoyladenosine biosynthesis protein TsaE
MPEAERELVTTSAEDTEAVGARLGAAATGGELLGLVGDLGAGKTCLVRGLVRGIGADPEAVHSPTFVLATEYRGGRLPVQHVDLYRLEPPPAEPQASLERPSLERPSDDELFFRELLYGPGIAAVEWFERLRPAAGEEFLLATLRYTRGGDHRVIRLRAHGARHRRWLAAAFGS